MPLPLYARIIDECAGARHLHLQGLGEPLLHPRLTVMIRRAVSRGVSVTLNTSLQTLAPGREYEIAESGVGTVYVSVDTPLPGRYERLRRNARFETLCRNLDRLTEAVRRLPPYVRPRIGLVAVGLRDELRRLPDLVRFAGVRGIDSVSVQNLCHSLNDRGLPDRYLSVREFVRGQTLLGVDASTVARAFSRTAATAEALGVELHLPKIRPEPGSRGACRWPWEGLYVNHRGDVMPCCVVASPDRHVPLASLSDGTSIASVWQGTGLASFRDRLASDSPPDICRGCSLYYGIF